MTTTHFTKLFAAISTFTIAACASSSIYAAIPTVGIYDENGNTDAVDVEATGNSQSLAQTKTDLAAAFAADTGGVWDFDTTVSGEFDNIGRDSFDLTYGTSQSNTLNLSVNGKLNQSNTSAAISGGSTLSFNSTQGSRVFTPDVPLLLVAVTVLDIGQDSREGGLSVEFDDGTTANTTLSPANTNTFHVLTANPSNPIVGFTLFTEGSNWLQHDDLAFIVAVDAAVPEPSTGLLLLVGLMGLVARPRRNRSRG